MKLTKHLLFACLLIWQVTAFADSDHKHDEHKEHKEHHDEHKHDDHKGHKDEHKRHDHDDHKGHDDHKDEHKHDEHEGHEEHGAHVHGEGFMTMAVGDDGLEIKLDSASYNLFGFGHKATSPEDKKTLNDNKAKLEQVASLFTINKSAGCEPVKTELESPLFEDHDDHAHEHKHDEKDEKHEGEGHSDVEASWVFKCKNAKEIHDVDMKLFSKFPRFEKIKVDWITPTKASTTTLTEDGTVELH